MRKELLNRLFDEFDEDKDTIKSNLLLAMDEVMLEASNDYQKVTLTIKIERKGSVNDEHLEEKERK